MDFHFRILNVKFILFPRDIIILSHPCLGFKATVVKFYGKKIRFSICRRVTASEDCATFFYNHSMEIDRDN